MRLLSGKGITIILAVAGLSLTARYEISMASDSGSQSNSPAPAPMLNPGDVILRWTATGDDGDVGRAAGYDMRYLPADMGPIDTEQKWNQATQVGGVPVPSPSGQMDSMLVRNLTPGGLYYFGIKAYDDAGNYSGLSDSPLKQAAVPGDFVPGDANGSENVDGLDVVFLVSFFKGGPPPPDPFLRADCNGNCVVNGTDVLYLITFLKGEGPAPVMGDCMRSLSHTNSDNSLH